MPAVHLDSVSFSYTSAVDILSEVSLSLGAGWHGLIGPNGAGKTTLLRLVLGDLEPTSGTVTLDPTDAVMARCPQVVDALQPEVEDFARSWEGADAALRSRLTLDPVDLERWDSLSPGERRRWQLATAVASRPDVLCVDEPTNHLDEDAYDLLVEELVRFTGVGIIVSHDRDLLDRLATHTIRLADGSARMWGGPYSVAAEMWRREEEETLAMAARLRRERDQARRRLQQRRQTLAETDQKDRARRRKAGVSDPDARSITIKNRQSNAMGSQSRATGVDARRLARIEDRLSEIKITGRPGGPISIDSEAARRPVLLSHRGPLQLENRTLAKNITLDIERDTRLRVIGPNGAGKTTLLRELIADPPIPPERILWLPQELSRAQRVGLLARVASLDAENKGEVMALAARLGLDPARVLDSDEPSPGEARKLWLADGLGRRVWVAVLDEPTNHLDLPSIERLEDALSAYQGALVLVTHDDRFARGLANQALELGESPTA